MTTSTLPTTKTKLAPKHARHLKYAAKTAAAKNITLLERPKPIATEVKIEPVVKQEASIDTNSALYNDQNKKVKLDTLEPIPVNFVIDTVGTTDNNTTSDDTIKPVDDTPITEPEQPKRKKHKKSKADTSDKHIESHNDNTAAISVESINPEFNETNNHVNETDHAEPPQQQHTQRDIRPSRVPRETVDYYKNIQSLLEQNTFDTPEERELTIQNVIRELCADDIDACFSLLIHPIVSRTVEYILQHSILVQRQPLLERIDTLLIDLIYHKNGCHVVETYIQCIVQDQQIDKIEHMLQQCEQHHYLHMISDTYATYPIRKLIQCCVDSMQSNKQFAQYFNTLVQQLLHISINELNTYIHNISAIPVYQIVIQHAYKSNTDNKQSVTKFVQTLLLLNNNNIDSQHAQLMSLLCDKITSRLLETILQLNDRELNTAILNVLLYKPNNVMFCATHTIANFPLQHLLQRITSLQQMEQIMSVFTVEGIQHIVAQNKLSVINALLHSVAVQYDVNKVMKLLCKALVTTIDSLVHTLLHIPNNNVNLHKHKSQFNNVSCTIVQSLIKLVQNTEYATTVHNSIVNSTELTTMCNDTAASHCIDTLIKHSGTTIHTALLKQLTGHLVDIACNQYGSYVLEALYNNVTVQNKQRICTELTRYIQRLIQSHIGQHAVRKYKLELLKRDAGQWLQWQNNIHKTKELLTDIIGTDNDINTTKHINHEVIDSVSVGGTTATAEIVDNDLKQVLNVISKDKKQKKHKH